MARSTGSRFPSDSRAMNRSRLIKRRDLKPVTEIVEVEGEMLSRVVLKDPVYGESPWEASYQLAL